MSEYSFEVWWDRCFDPPQFGLTKDCMKLAYIAGFNACRDAWSGLDYEETVEMEAL